ncbi:dolichyl-diphosphooligosaccharide--protein glycosyltransferase subunit TMEM258 [Ara ararauna]
MPRSPFRFPRVAAGPEATCAERSGTERGGTGTMLNPGHHFHHCPQPVTSPRSPFALSPQELEAMSRYTSPVNPAVFPHLTVVLLAIGMFFTAWFFVYEVTSTKYTRDIYKELLISLVASLFMGFGVLFLLLWVGIYV